jgi:hypothetical protein
MSATRVSSGLRALAGVSAAAARSRARAQGSCGDQAHGQTVLRTGGDVMANDGPKTALEIAMERLRQKDREEGVEERPLSDEQKAAIAEVRKTYEARIAEREILHRDALRKARSREEIDKLDAELALDRDRLARDRDRKLAEIRDRRDE